MLNYFKCMESGSSVAVITQYHVTFFLELHGGAHTEIIRTFQGDCYPLKLTLSFSLKRVGPTPTIRLNIMTET